MSARSDQVKESTGDLALENGELVAQHEDLGFRRHRVHPVDTDRFQDADKAVAPRTTGLIELDVPGQASGRANGPFRSMTWTFMKGCAQAATFRAQLRM